MKHSKYIVSPLRFFLLLAVPFLFSVSVWAVDASYYSSLEGKSGSTLRSAITNLVYTKHTTALGYNWTFDGIDIVGGEVLDMYSTCSWTQTSDQCGGYSGICDCYNREHTVPQSLFSEKSPQVGDRHHLFLTDGKVNNIRSNYAFGETNTTNTWSGVSNGTKALGQLGKASYAYSTSVTVFEPDDAYKGDIARAIMYMAVRYATNNECREYDGTSNSYPVTTWGSNEMFSGSLSTNYGLSDAAVQTFLKWHRADPVSQKEIDRNTGVEAKQGNRNPFIDYPCLVEYLWGNKKDQTFNLSSVTGSFESGFVVGTSDGCSCATTDPTLSVSSSSITIDPIATSTSTTQTFTVTGVNLTDTISITKTGSSYIKVSTTSIPAASANGSHEIIITYNAPASEGTHTATLTISSTGATPVTVNITASCAAAKTITWHVDGSEYTTGSPTTSVGSGGSVTQLPTAPTSGPSGCTSKVFVGWSETNIGATSQDSAPSDLFTSTSASACQNITSNKDFYAVYADKETSGGGSPVVTTVFSTTSLGSTNTVTTGYTVSATASAKSGYYQDGSGTSGVTIYNTTTPMFTSTPTAISLTVSIGAGKGNLDFSDYVYATLVNGSGTAIGTAVQITNHVTTSTGDSYTVSIPTTGVTSANGIYLYHTKESGQNIRYYSASLSITTGGSTTTYKNYSTTCSTGPTVTVTFHANGGTGTMPAQTIPQSTNATLSANTFTRDGYSFAGWATTSSGAKVYDDGGTINTSSNIDLYAKWTALPTITMTFMNNGVQHTTRSGYAGQTVSSAVPDPTACEGYTFEGWSTSTYAADNTDTPSWADISTVPASNTTYHAVYSKTEVGGGSAASAGTTLWSEDFSGYNANDVPSGSITNSHTGTTVYSGTLTYAVANGGGTTKVYAENNAGGTSPELLIAKSNGSFSISNLPTGSAATMTLLFNTNKYSYPSSFSITSGTSGITFGSLSSPATNQLSCTITNGNNVETFDLTITYTYSQNSREDDFLLTVATAGSGGSTTYHTTSPSCAPTNYSITVNAGAGGTASGTGTYTSGSSQSISATANSCYQFSQWNDGNTDNPRTITVTGDATYTASFQQINYTITATTDDDAKGTVNVTTP